jgi:GNAT superfamily N-acetyltransferase
MSALFSGDPPDPTLAKPAAGDLAPGDEGSAAFDWTGIEVHLVRDTQDALFPRAYSFLWETFGKLGELEQPAVLAQRFAWDPAQPLNGCALLYEMLVLRSGDQIAAVRDHTAIVPVEWGGPPRAIVHLSHVLVAPAWRRTGLAGWLRAWPILTARDSLFRAGLPETSAITLVSEMEPPDAADPDRFVRLRAYERAGFMKVQPSAFAYLQPDFRPSDQIDADPNGTCPLPMVLVMRRVKRESEPWIFGGELHDLVHALYAMYSATFRPSDMAALYERLYHDFPDDDAMIPLSRPTR